MKNISKNRYPDAYQLRRLTDLSNLKKFVVREIVTTETTTVVYGKNEKEALNFYGRGINDCPKVITENKTTIIQPSGGI